MVNLVGLIINERLPGLPESSEIYEGEEENKQLLPMQGRSSSSCRDSPSPIPHPPRGNGSETVGRQELKDARCGKAVYRGAGWFPEEHASSL